MLVDHAVGVSGPHRNVVGSLNALSARSDVDLRLLTGKIDKNEPYADRCDIRLGFAPHEIKQIAQNLQLLLSEVKDRDLIYVPTGLKSFLYAYIVKGKRKLVAGPNVTGIPFLMKPANPSPLMTTAMSDGWIEMSEIRIKDCISGGTARETIHYVPHSVDSELFSPKRRNPDVWAKEGLSANSIKIVYVGNMHEEFKGVPQLINAFEMLRQAVHIKLELVLIGEDGPMLTDHHRAMPGVSFLGPRFGDSLIELLASADLFMAASRWETFWLTPLEAMACGLPVVVSNVGAVPSMIPNNGVQGISVQITDAHHEYVEDAAKRLAEAALPLLNDSNMRREIGCAARSHVVQKFSETELANRLMRVFTSTME